MTRVRQQIGGRMVAIIQDEPEGRCELCGKVAETRPYGPHGEEVCFPCGMKNPQAAKQAFAAFLDGGREA